MCCSVLVCCSAFCISFTATRRSFLSKLHFDLQHVVVCYSLPMYCSVLQCVAVCLQCVAVFCGVFYIFFTGAHKPHLRVLQCESQCGVVCCIVPICCSVFFSPWILVHYMCLLYVFVRAVCAYLCICVCVCV